MSNRLGGKQGTSYLGTNANQPPNMVFARVDPTSKDINNVTIGDMWINTINETSWQLVSLKATPESGGSVATWDQINGGGGISQVDTDSGNAIPIGGAISLIADPTNLNAGSSVSFSAVDNIITFNVSDSDGNTIIGNNSGNASPGGSNTVLGVNSGLSISSGFFNTILGSFNAPFQDQASFNVIIGSSAGSQLTTGSDNIMIGVGSGPSLVTGTDNILIGQGSGSSYVTNEAANIVIGVNTPGVVDDQNSLRIGIATGSGGGGLLNSAFIQGIRGITTINDDAIAVLIDSAGQLGTVSSSRTLKHNIKDMADDSSEIYNLRPVTFAYNSDATDKKQYGLIAEEAHEVLPGIVVYDKEGLPQSVQYHILPSLLLNELQKLAARVAVLEAREKHE